MMSADPKKASSELGYLNETTERELMAGIAAGNEAAFQELVAVIRPLIFSVIHRTIGNANDADDICQTVLLALWNRADSWNPSKGRVSTWVATIARNRAVDHVRKISRAAKMRERLAAETAVLAPASLGSTADDDLVGAEARRATRRALRELAPEQRQAIELAFIEGLTQVEVAERAGLPLGTAKARIRRGMISLRRSLPLRLAA